MRTSITLQRIIFSITAIPLFSLLTGCFQNFYKATPETPAGLAQNIGTPQYENRYFILRSGSDAYYMSSLHVSDDKQTLLCHLERLPYEHELHLLNGNGGNMRYKKKANELGVLNEVHLYIQADSSAKTGNDYTLALNKVQKVEVLEKNKGKTTASYVLGGVSIAVGTLLIVGLIALATKSSCPFVSAYDGNEMKLQGEIYGGAIYPQLARNDYLKLNMAPASNGKLQLQISNELHENQYTDIAELLVVTHNKNVSVVADENGNLHSIAQPVLPVSATSAGKDVMPLIAKQNDDFSFQFNDTLAAQQNNNTLNLSFNKPANAANAKLVLHLKNTYWLDMLYGKFTQAFGQYYPTFMKVQSNKPAEQLLKWRNEQQMPLQISLQTNNGWQTQQSLTTVGPLANRETAIPIDLSKCSSDKINVQLSTGFMFWEIDYAAIDFSSDADMQVSVLQPLKASDETGASVLPQLAKDDENYLSQPLIGNAAVIEYNFTPLTDTGKTQTYILHAKGYYTHIRNYTNTADQDFLNKFKQPGAMSNFSMELYKQTMNADLSSIAAK